MSSQVVILVIQRHLCLLLMIQGVAAFGAPGNSVVIAMPGCNDTCGNVGIPYPFGMGANHNCFYDDWFHIDCVNSTKPFLSKLNVEVLNIPFTYEISVGDSLTVAVPPLKSCSAQPRHTLRSQIDLSGKKNPYKYSTRNVFTMQGCSGYAALLDESNRITAGCATVCHSNISAISATDSCNGVECCQAPRIQTPLSFYDISFYHNNSSGISNCLSATLAKPDSAENPSSLDLNGSITLPIELGFNWEGNTYCTKFDNLYYGNKYVPNGCQVPGNCKGCRVFCRQHWDGDGSVSFSCDVDWHRRLGLILGPSISFVVILLGIGIYKLYRYVIWKREMKQRAKFFKRNGGLLLRQQLLANEGAREDTKIYTVDELDKATDHFNENMILGKGGQGTVFKGMLMDGRIVAIKKANLLDESQLEQFINEVVILSQINHRNVVKILGCCLEMEVPMLVYEFISNGTLSEHIHDPDEDSDSVISWEICLRIAADSASAIAYLHSSSSIPIFHRDIKSSNILLDEKHRARVSDFGSSRTIAIDQTHMTTLVQGTLGYLDPEYFQSYQFTEKSDVYSFGVVLLEILTGKNPIYMDTGSMEQKNLVTEFLFLSQRDMLSSILDLEIVKQAKQEEVIAVVELAKICTSLSGRLRPTMKEVAMTLEMIMKSPTRAPTCYHRAFQVPHDGFTNEVSSP